MAEEVLDVVTSGYTSGPDEDGVIVGKGDEVVDTVGSSA